MKKFLLLVVMATSVSYAGTQMLTNAFPKERTNLIEIDEEEYCLALNVYHEARSEPLVGKFAVSDVVLNRVRDSRWPDTICGVIYDGPTKPSWNDETKLIPIRDRCQFSWYCDGKDDTPLDQEAWYEARIVAHDIINRNRFRGVTEGATHYHASYVKPEWRTWFYPVGRIGSHIFYRSE